MKTVLKRLLSITLVAMMLLSAVPFQASAATEFPVWVKAYTDAGYATAVESSVLLGEDAGYGDIADFVGNFNETDGWGDAKALFSVSKYAEDYTLNAAKGEEYKEGILLRCYVTAKQDDGNGEGDGEGEETDEFTVKTTITEGMSIKVETLSGTYTEDEAKELTNIQLAGASKYANTADYTLSGRSGPTKDGDVLKFELTATPVEKDEEEDKDDEGDDGDDEGKEPGGEHPDDETVLTKVAVEVNLGLGYGWQTRNMEAGKTFAENGLVKPERGGYDCLGFYYVDEDGETLGKVDLKDDYPEEGDRLQCKWSSPKKFTITYDLNRKDMEPVNKIISVEFGEEIYDRLYAYKPSKKGDVFMGWKINGVMVTEDYVYEYPGEATAYAVWKLASDTPDEPMGGSDHEKDGEVYLEIYRNDNTDDLFKRVNITDYAGDDKITRAEAEKVVKKYVTAKSGYNLKFIGLFDEDGWWWYTRDPETNGEDSIIVNRDGDDYVYVMVNNAKIKTPDSENPPTGDAIYVAVTVMGLSATALAAAYFFKKKRTVQ